MKRCAGVLLAISSLPSKYGIGDFGKQAYKFIDYLKKADFKIWQILPLNPLGYGNSPYQPYSSKAMDPIYISLDLLREEGLISRLDAFNATADRVDYEGARAFKDKKLARAYENYRTRGDFAAFDAWKKDNEWVYNYAVFLTLKKQNDLKMWSEWPIEQQNWINDHKYSLSIFF